MRWLRGPSPRERGQDVVEYGLIVAVFALMAGVGGVTLSHAEKGYFSGLQSVTNNPTITFLSTTANPTSSTAAQFTFTSSYLIAAFNCSITGSTSSACNAGAPWPASPATVGEGLRTVSVTGTFSGVAAAGSYQWVVDRTNPRVTGITLPASGAFYNAAGWAAGCGFCGGATDPLAGSPPAAAGVQQVQLQIRNNSNSQYWTGTGWSATATWVAASGTTGWGYALPIVNFPSAGTPTQYTVSARAVDAAGNVGTVTNGSSPEVRSTSFYIDRTAPTVTLTAPANGSSTNSTTPTFSGAGGIVLGDSTTVTVKVYSGSGTNGTLVQTRTASISSGTYSVAASPALAAGTYTAQASQSDSAGNVGTSAAVTFTIDTTPPTVTIARATGQANPTKTSPVNFTAVFSKPVTGFSASGVGVTGTAGGTKTATVTGSGTTYTVAVSGMTTDGTVIAAVKANAAKDVAGNYNQASNGGENTVAWDVSGPTVTTTFPANSGSYNATTWAAGCTAPGICGTAADPSGVQSVQVSIRQGNGNYWNGTSFGSTTQVWNAATGTDSWSYALAKPAVGTYTLQVKATDALGNTTTTSSITFTTS